MRVFPSVSQLFPAIWPPSGLLFPHLSLLVDGFIPDPEIRESSSSFVVVLVLDFIGYCAEKRADLPGNYFVPFV